MCTLHPVHCRLDYTHIRNINPTVVIQIVHTTRSISIDNHVDSIPVLVATLACATTRIAQREVVCGRAKAGQDLYASRGDPVHLKILQHQLYLVEECFAKNYVFGERCAVMSDEVAQREMIRHMHPDILGRHLDKTRRIVVRIRMHCMQFRRPVTQVVRADEFAPFRIEWNQSDERERMSTNSARYFVYSRCDRSGREQMDAHSLT